ncbi:MAG: ATP-dependent DNA helicase RecG [Gudongella sp.]|nr:ATP-dependent DNA helicase RecG [Gudongella sp.]
MSAVDNSISILKGIGPKKMQKFKKLGIETIKDLVYHIPRDYEDRTNTIKLREGLNGEKYSFIVTVTGYGNVIRPRRGLSILQVPVTDSSGDAVLVWFNQDFLKKVFQPGQRYLVYGKLSANKFQVQIQSPEYLRWYENISWGIRPIYPLTEGITNNEIIKIMNNLLREYDSAFDTCVPEKYLIQNKILNKAEALKSVHEPKSIKEAEFARKSLAYEELLILQLALFKIKKNTHEEIEGIKFKLTNEYNKFLTSLPFELTGAQKKVLTEISSDMCSSKRMNRLIQGDVGSGKTIVGIAAMYLAVLNGYQSAMMAPTEILAQQHYETFKSLLGKYNLYIVLLSGSMLKKDKERVLNGLRDGIINVVVGTHAIIQENVEFDNLGLIITDEQHRFGVKQRLALSDKGDYPDMLVMTATPIPRTLALILYGDLDISIIDELPPGRKPIETYSVGYDMENRIYTFIKKQIQEGRQAYIVCPAIEENENTNVVSAEELYERLSRDIFTETSVGLLHGKMPQKEKDLIMEKFKNDEIKILIATTVIEVGVNIPNASIMVVMSSERFGLAQLHQLRGRIGRGEYQSYCILINGSYTEIARERMRIMQSTSDGFIISEKDLQIRGPGEFFGTRQHGIPDFRIANLFRDVDVLKIAQRDATEIIEADPRLYTSDNALLSIEVNSLIRKLTDEIILN